MRYAKLNPYHAHVYRLLGAGYVYDVYYDLEEVGPSTVRVRNAKGERPFILHPENSSSICTYHFNRGETIRSIIYERPLTLAELSGINRLRFNEKEINLHDY